MAIVRPTDKAAIRDAKKLVDGHDIEVWQGGRPVTRLKSKWGTGTEAPGRS
jgi:hypothetical protein